mmetsp:Transcript_72920/g.173702  ORF Transcript_72920/g.173702 Transcript_72920/m.173702 type:complete len:201 (-) Transcript_72920:2864-3466(-)
MKRTSRLSMRRLSGRRRRLHVCSRSLRRRTDRSKRVAGSSLNRRRTCSRSKALLSRHRSRRKSRRSAQWLQSSVLRRQTKRRPTNKGSKLPLRSRLRKHRRMQLQQQRLLQKKLPGYNSSKQKLLLGQKQRRQPQGQRERRTSWLGSCGRRRRSSRSCERRPVPTATPCRFQVEEMAKVEGCEAAVEAPLEQTRTGAAPK